MHLAFFRYCSWVASLSLGAATAALVAGCSVGLDSSIDAKPVPTADGRAPIDGTGDNADDGAGDADADAGLPATTVALEGQVYRIDPDRMTIVSPPGLDALKESVLERDILAYIDLESNRALGFSVALANTDGEQDDCEVVRAFPNADWTLNPVFEAGPGTIETSFGGQAAQLRNVRFGGVFDEYGFGWTDGTLSAELDGRELGASLGDVDVCELVDALGGACEACGDGERLCFTVEIEDITAVKAEITFDPENDGSRCDG